MTRLIEFPLEDGGSIWVEVMSQNNEMTPVMRGGNVPEKAHHTFESAFEKVRPTAIAIITKLRTLHDPPDKIEVEFGLTMNAETGVIVAAASVEANYKVTLTWERKQ